MHLTAFSNYALRTLMYAALRGDKLSHTKDIAAAYRLPKAHLIKCVHQLGQWGYLENIRGRGGGFRLAKPADQITIGEVIRRTENGLDLVECFAPVTNTCPLMEFCLLSRTFKEALSAFLKVLDQKTLADIVANDSELRPPLGLDTPPHSNGP